MDLKVTNVNGDVHYELTEGDIMLRVAQGKLALVSGACTERELPVINRLVAEARQIMKTGEYTGAHFESVTIESAPEKMYTVWLHGGMLTQAAYLDAIALIEAQRNTPASERTEWEVRKPGEAVGDDFESYNDLDRAVDAAMPGWRNAGLSLHAAALLAMNSGALLSTGISVDEWADWDTDERGPDGDTPVLDDQDD